MDTSALKLPMAVAVTRTGPSRSGEWADKYKGKFDMGWEKLRNITYQKQWLSRFCRGGKSEPNRTTGILRSMIAGILLFSGL